MGNNYSCFLVPVLLQHERQWLIPQCQALASLIVKYYSIARNWNVFFRKKAGNLPSNICRFILQEEFKWNSFSSHEWEEMVLITLYSFFTDFIVCLLASQSELMAPSPVSPLLLTAFQGPGLSRSHIEINTVVSYLSSFWY